MRSSIAARARGGQMRFREGDALIAVDVQRDFLPGGSLAVPEGHEVVPVLNGYISRFQQQGLLVVATRDWHPRDHCSFDAQGGSWPAHCVQDSDGAAFADELELPEDAIVISKGARKDSDAYSGFDDTDLGAVLRQRGVERLFIGGLATDYCVLATVIDALEAGFDVVLLRDAVRAVGIQPTDETEALAAMRDAGARSIELAALDDAA